MGNAKQYPGPIAIRFVLWVAVCSIATGCAISPSISDTDSNANAAAAVPNCAVIAHRGASGYMPEHTLPAYEEAIRLGADFIEPDVILSKEGVPVVRHESWLSLTTDIAERAEFADRRRIQVITDSEVDDWFSEDLTMAEIASLRAVERYPELRPQSARLDRRFPVASLQQVINLWQQARAASGRDIGLYPELKQVAYFAERGLDVVQITIDTVKQNGLTGPQDGVLLQSFEAPALQRAAQLTDLPLVQLVESKMPEQIADAISPAAMARIAAYADGIGVPKGWVYTQPPAESAVPLELTALVKNAHDAGLFVHVFTFRAENKYLSPVFRRPDQPTGNLAGQIRLFLEAGIDGFFTDNPDIGRAVCDAWQADFGI